MCRNVAHHQISRNVCICFAVYALFGMKVPCNIFCSATSVPEYHLDTLFHSAANNTVMSKQQLSNFLDTLHLTPHDHGHDEEHANHTSCYSAEQMISFFPNTVTLTKQQFGQLLPTILYEIHTDACHHDHTESSKSRKLDWKAIVASAIAVAVISVSGLIVVALIPLMPRRFFNVTSQFLIALSVGSLIGDAFLHLIPHALAPEHHHDHDESSHSDSESHGHQGMITKSLVALLGIYAFFLTERLTILCQNNTFRQKMKKQRTATNDWNDGKDLTYPVEHNGSVKIDTDKPESANAMHKYRSSIDGAENPSFSAANEPSHTDSDLCSRPPERPLDNARCTDHLSGDSHVRPNSTSGSHTHIEQNDSPVHHWPAAIYVPPTGTGKASDGLASPPSSPGTLSPHMQSKRTAAHEMLDAVGRNGKAVKWKQTAVSAETGLFRTNAHPNDTEGQPTHPHRDKPHGHHHGHSHDLSSVRAIAYTVIVGDGLHNFCDGIAIGAAFSTDISGGLSTAIAVLCHELPHELGDFAVLLHAGMSVKAAVFYNLLSSILCAAGTVLGLLLGRVASIDTWIFMLTAGMFVYIALVDMMPELATNRMKGHRYCHKPSTLFIWQNVGILLGYSVMLVIALYENQFY